MLVRQSRGVNRGAFTLIELMMVVLIIAVLAAMLLGAVQKVMIMVPQVQTSTDIAQMSQALHAFMADFQINDPPPSTLVLDETSPLSVAAVHPHSAAFLTKAFGKNLGPTDWNGDSTIGGTWILTGEQCLIFYLTGIPNTAATGGVGPYQGLGFSYNKLSPGTPGGRRHGPYITLQSSTLSSLGKPSRGLYPQANPNAPHFLVYYDAWAQKTASMPIAYFSSSGVNNQYTVNSLLGATPYLSSPGQYINPNTYQIISAGHDHVFGGGSIGGATALGTGADDQANFSSSTLGAGVN